MVDQRRIDDQRYVDARAAAKHLGIQIRTLYAYVSRGQVRSVAGGKGRPRRYAFADLERLRVRRDARKGHGAVAAGALRWGEPVLDSAITQITPRGPSYRGHLAVDLTGFENVAELLWSGYLPMGTVRWPRTTLPFAQLGKLGATRPLDAMALVISVAAIHDPQRGDPRPDAFLARGRALIPLLAASLATGTAAITRALGASSIAGICGRALDTEHVALIDRALVLLADHELNASSFSARVTASTDADPYACVLAALATLTGPKHGTASEEVSRFADGIAGPDDARAAIRALERRGETLPAFGHPLYPAGDPRSPPLLAMLRPLATTKRARTLIALADASATPASVDVALAALAATIGAPPSAASGLFAVARSAGWLAHALEQRAAGFLLRPRARYIGVTSLP